MKESLLELAQERLQRLAEVSARLNDAADLLLTADLAAIEEAVNKLNAGVECSLDDSFAVGPSGDASARGERGISSQTAYYLAYGKWSDGWRLLVRRCEERVDDRDQIIDSTFQDAMPLLKASRGFKRAASEQILELLDRIAVAAEEEVTTLEKALEARTA